MMMDLNIKIKSFHISQEESDYILLLFHDSLKNSWVDDLFGRFYIKPHEKYFTTFILPETKHSVFMYPYAITFFLLLNFNLGSTGSIGMSP